MTTNSGVRKGKRPALLLVGLDVAVPVGTYYLLRNAAGLSEFAALAWSSVYPAVRAGWGLVWERVVNAFAVLILLVNVTSMVLGLLSGDARMMLVRESAIGSVIGIGVLVSVALGKPMMTSVMKSWLIRGQEAREAAWERLMEGSAAFRRAERRYSLVWGGALLGECVVRVIGAYALPVDTMVWLGTVMMIVTLVGAFLVGGALGAGPMAAMLAAEARTPGVCGTTVADAGRAEGAGEPAVAV